MPSLYIARQELHVTLASKHVEVHDEAHPVSRRLERVPIMHVDRMTIVGRPRVSMRIVERLLRENKPVHILSRQGGLIGSFTPARDADAVLRINQYRLVADPWGLGVARALVAAKLRNSRRVLQKLAAGRVAQAERMALAADLDTLARLAGRAELAEDLATVRGYEGMGAAIYYERLRPFFAAGMPFTRRSRRPPADPANALLSWTYTIVMQEVRGAICAAGLDPCIGSLHAISYNRPALALDLMEPLRAPLCDLFILRLINLGMIRPADFQRDEENGGCRMTRQALGIFFKEY